MPDLIEPHGGTLVDLMAGPERAEELKKASRDWPSLDLDARQLCDLELLLNGGFSPLTGFMTRADYEPVVEDMRLADGTLWPIPGWAGRTGRRIRAWKLPRPPVPKDPRGWARTPL